MTWRSSSYSAASGNCVQVRGDLAAVRDSKNPTGPTLTTDLAQLLATVKSGDLMTWRTSSFSGPAGNCVQIRGDLAAVRDSKNPAGPTLTTDLTRLLAAVKSGELGR